MHWALPMSCCVTLDTRMHTERRTTAAPLPSLATSMSVVGCITEKSEHLP